MSTLYARYTDLLRSATFDTTAGAIDALFPIANLTDGRAETVFKFTGTSGTIRATFAAPVTLQGLALINHNLAGATVTVANGAGFSEVLTIPATPADSLTLDPWGDYRGLANTSDDVWTIAITGAAGPIAIGELLLVETLRELDCVWGVELGEAHPDIQHRTAGGARLTYSHSTRARRFAVNVKLESERANLVTLRRGALGRAYGFLFILDEDENDACLVEFLSDEQIYRLEDPRLTEIVLDLGEQQKGVL